MAKSPAFQMYPNDFLGSGKVAAMDLEQTGAYTLLLCYDWNEGGLPNDLKILARWIRVSERKFEKLWKQIKGNFELKNGRWYNPRLERERAKQEANRKKKRDAAAARWHPSDAPAHTDADAPAYAPAMRMECSQTPIAVASAFPSELPTTDDNGAREGIPDIVPELLDLVPEQFHRDLGSFLGGMTPSRRLGWSRNLVAKIEGMHPPKVSSAIVGSAIRQMIANGETNWKRFEGYCRLEEATPPVRAVHSHIRRNAGEENYENALRALEDVPG